MTRDEILREAAKCVCGEREQEYGKAENNIGLISDLWSKYTGIDISPIDVCMMMCMLKIARVKSGTMTEDSFIDICGYSSIAGELYGSEVSKLENSMQKVFSNTKLEDMPYIFQSQEE